MFEHKEKTLTETGNTVLPDQFQICLCKAHEDVSFSHDQNVGSEL